MHRPPAINGVSPSRIQLPAGDWATVLDVLCARFPAIDRATWRDRFAQGKVLDAQGRAMAEWAAHRSGAEVFYYREVEDEPAVPAVECIVHMDAHLIVVDKPHFLPVVPSGRFVHETLLARLVRRFGNTDIAPLHRLDRLTAGLVLFSCNRATRADYQALFREQRILKRYQALAAPLPDATFPHLRRSRIEIGEPFFRMREAEGEPNSATRIDVIERSDAVWRYALEPVSGRKHQLRVHLAALGAPIIGDPLYPQLSEPQADDAARPLQLLARELKFDDPLDGRARRFESGLRLPALIR